MAVVSTAVITAVYMLVGGATWGAKGLQGYGVLPTFAISTDVENDHTYISLIFFVVAALVEGVILAFFLDSIREIKKEFSMLPELQVFTGLWLTMTDLALFIVIQGIAANWFSEITYYRVVFLLLWLRSVLVSLASALKPLMETSGSGEEDAALFFPIPPNRECIESVDMVLHIPIAVDYFYSYLQSRHEQLKDKQAIHLIALYIDLRLYDKACTDNETD